MRLCAVPAPATARGDSPAGGGAARAAIGRAGAAARILPAVTGGVVGVMSLAALLGAAAVGS